MAAAENNKKKTTKKSKPVEEVIVEETVTVEPEPEFVPVDKKAEENRLLWIAVSVLGGILAIIVIVQGFQAFANSMKYYMSTNRDTTLLEQTYREGYSEGYYKGYDDGYNDAFVTVEPPMYEPNCDYEYMLQYGYQDGCTYLPENENIQPDTYNQNGMVTPKQGSNSMSR